ncbi:TrmH family RNA methyltransferase [Aquamicrobium ahrensii]|uniref:tRNA G18 (Ribose-2'-O)-methylase SpoU n=1 Tax=Aquamicrobium ahrensii TaxID=469551 RepID=A0ABV2KJ26_9HYPH
MKPIRIENPQDERVSAYVDIRERDLVGRQGRFVAEGKVVLDVLTSTRRFGIESVLVLENRLAGLQHILERLPQDVPVYVAGSEVLDRIAGFHMHRGILAIGRRGELPDAAGLLDTLTGGALVAVLVGISNHDNVGSIFRNAAAFGADAVLLDRTSCDPLYRKAIRVSVGAALKVPFAVFDDPPALADMLAARGFTQFALSPRGELDIRDARCEGPLALYLGTEGEGLPEAILSRIRTARIAMAPGFDSLNVAAASAIALHRFARITE